MAARTIVTLKVTLTGSRPPIWRRLMVPGSMTLGDLHQAIQIAFGWYNSHLHAFDIEGRQFGDPELMEGDGDYAYENRKTLNALIKAGVGRFDYTYDFGDDWEHRIVIEKPRPVVPGQFYPACVAGKRAGPPEDCGGVPGYEELIEIMKDPAHPEREERLEWIGGEFDPEAFSLPEINAAIVRCFGDEPRA